MLITTGHERMETGLRLTVDWKQDIHGHRREKPPPTREGGMKPLGPRTKAQHPSTPGALGTGSARGRRGRGCRREAAFTPRATQTPGGLGSLGGGGPGTPGQLLGGHAQRGHRALCGCRGVGPDGNVRGEDAACRKRAPTARAPEQRDARCRWLSRRHACVSPGHRSSLGRGALPGNCSAVCHPVHASKLRLPPASPGGPGHRGGRVAEAAFVRRARPAA